MSDATPKCPLCGVQMRRPVSGRELFCKSRGCGIAWLTDEQLAKLSAPPAAPPPPANTVRVRVAVGIFGDDASDLMASGGTGDDRRGVDDIEESGYRHIAWIVADIPLPTVPEIVGRVEEAKHERD